MKKVGIAADNYKIETFEKELKKAGFHDYEVFPFCEETSIIKVNVLNYDVTIIGQLIKRVEEGFKQAKYN